MTNAAIFLQHPFMVPSRMWSMDPGRAHRYERVGVVVLVVLLHVSLGLAWMMQPEPPKIVVNEMSVSVAIQQAQVAQPQSRPLPPPPKPKPRIEPVVKPQPKPVVEEAVESLPEPLPVPVPVAAAEPVPVAAPAPVAPAPVAAPVPDTEPDFRAEYLNNPRPNYPMVARRMGWGGKVILDVEVLASGACGALKVALSSGHEVLDKAAMKTVKSWRFVPAHHAGQAITKWFKVPIVFSVEGSEA